MVRRLLFLTVLAVVVGSLASAAPLGYIDVANCASGGVTVSATTIDWTLPAGPTNGCIQTGGATNVSYTGGGPLIAGVSGTILDLAIAIPPPITDFLAFAGNANLHFNLTGLGPGVANTTCSTGNVGDPACSVFAGSPFVLTPTPGGTAVSLAASGIATDGSAETSPWFGGFTTQITGQTPAAIQANILAGFSVSSTYSASFVVGVPEPGTIGMVLLGGLLIGGARLYRRRRSE